MRPNTVAWGTPDRMHRLRTRIATSPNLRRLLPTRLAVLRAQAKGDALWRSSAAVRADALAAMSAIVGEADYEIEGETGHEIEGETSQAIIGEAEHTIEGEMDRAIVGEADREVASADMARLHVIENEVRNALFWQPWVAPEMDAESAGRLRAALSDPRGLLLSTCHLGAFFLAMSAVAATGTAIYGVGGAWFFEEPSADLWGRRLARWRSGCERRNERVLPAPGSFATLRALLERGETVNNYYDMPGKRRTSFLGRDALLADGTARLASATGALVLPLRTRRAAHRVWVDTGEPLDPQSFADADALHGALARIHERWILQAPWTLEDPRRPGAWEDGASATGWALPAKRQLR